MNLFKQSLDDESFGIWNIEGNQVDVVFFDMVHPLFDHGHSEGLFDLMHPACVYGTLRDKRHDLEMAVSYQGDEIFIILKIHSEWGYFEEFYSMTDNDLWVLMDYCQINTTPKHDWLKEGF